MNYSQAIEFLYSLRPFGTKLGLENTFALARLAEAQPERLRFVHVAGTNGKGSVCAMLESIYRASGRKVGLFTSPHLVSFTERIQVNRVRIAEAEVARLTALIRDRLGGADSEKWPFRPTFFEVVTIMALLHFARENCDLIIWETGLGGRLDSTNIVTPVASLITNIQFDHQQWLGNTLAQIAAEKAGIIKPSIPVLTAAESPEALDVIRARAAELKAPLTVVDWAEEKPLSLLGAHQKKNAALARAAVNVLRPQFPVPAEIIDAGLANTFWPGRLQLVCVPTPAAPTRSILLDGAHNPDGAATLANALKTQFAAEPKTLILGLFKDKEWPQMCETLVPLAARVILVPVQSERSADLSAVAQFCARWGQVRLETAPSVQAALAQSASDPLTVVAGSLHLIGETMEKLGLTPDQKPERELNEWDAAGPKSG